MTFLWLAAVLAILSEGELAVRMGHPLAALGVDLVLLFGLILASGIGTDSERRLALALSLAPLIRVISLALPPNLLPLAWYALGSLCLLAACGVASRLLGYSPADLGWTAGVPLDQLAIGSLGLPVAVAAFLIDTQPPRLPMSSVAAMLVSSSVLAGVGVVEEMVFRGVLQRAAFSLLRGKGLVYVSALFMVLHTGVGGGLTALLVFGVGLLFAQLALRSGSLLGVAAAHGCANALIYVVLPALAYRAR